MPAQGVPPGVPGHLAEGVVHPQETPGFRIDLDLADRAQLEARPELGFAGPQYLGHPLVRLGPGRGEQRRRRQTGRRECRKPGADFKFGRKHRSHALIEVVDGKDVQTIVRGGAGAD